MVFISQYEIYKWIKLISEYIQSCTYDNHVGCVCVIAVCRLECTYIYWTSPLVSLGWVHVFSNRVYRLSLSSPSVNINRSRGDNVATRLFLVGVTNMSIDVNIAYTFICKRIFIIVTHPIANTDICFLANQILILSSILIPVLCEQHLSSTSSHQSQGLAANLHSFISCAKFLTFLQLLPRRLTLLV